MKKRAWKGKSLSVDILFTAAGVAQQVWIEHGNRSLLVDAGDGTLRDLLAYKHRPESIDGILITHGHFDHMGGLYSLLGFMRMIGRPEDLIVVYPEECSEVIEVVRTFTALYTDTLSFTIVMRPVRDDDIVEIGNLHVTARDVIHCGSISGAGILDPIPAVGYRITGEGETVAVTGDTGDCPAVRELVSGADLAVVEATFTDEDVVEPGTLDKVHLDTRRAEMIGSLARDYILVHRHL
jgi:ribonuclease Z